MAGLRISKGVVGVVKETTPFTYLEPAAGDSFPAFDISIDFAGDSYLRKETKAHMGKLPELPGMAEGTISFKVLAVGGAAAATPPYYGNTLLGCGMREEITAGTNVSYIPYSTFDAATGAGPPSFKNPYQTVTVAVWEDGIQYAIKGAAGTVKVSGSAGEPVVLEFQFKGAYVAPAADTTPTITISTLVPPRFLSATLSVQGVGTLIIKDWSMDLGNDLQMSVSANDSAGIRGAYIADRRITASFNPEMELPATHDFFATWRAATQGAMSWGPIGSVAGNRLAFNAAATQYRAPKLEERGGIRSLAIDCGIVTTGAEGSDFYLRWT